MRDVAAIWVLVACRPAQAAGDGSGGGVDQAVHHAAVVVAQGWHRVDELGEPLDYEGGAGHVSRQLVRRVLEFAVGDFNLHSRDLQTWFGI